MEVKTANGVIEVIYKINKTLLTIENDENTANFINNWYFLNHYSETNKFENAFAVKYV